MAKLDIIELLEDNGVKVDTIGKNVSTGWIGIQCIFCDDSSNHLGIKLDDYSCSCWKCGRHSIVTLLSEITDLSKKEIRKFLKNADKVYDPDLEKPKAVGIPGKRYEKNLNLSEASKSIPTLHYKYLLKRGFHPHLLSRKYDLSFVSTVGRYKFRIIIPYYYKRKKYSFTSRAIDNRIIPAYLNPRKTDVPMSPKEMVYNIDNLLVGHDAVAVEGPIDVWKFGDGAIGFSGLTFTKYQISLLIEKKIRNLFIIFDNDIIDIQGRKTKSRVSKTRAQQFFSIMKHYCRNVEIVENNFSKDLGELSQKNILELKQVLEFNERL